VCPLDVLKTRLQVQRISGTKRVGIVGGLSGIAQAEGIKGLYRGLAPTLMALLPNWAVYFSVYGRLKVVLTTRQGQRLLLMGVDGRQPLHRRKACSGSFRVAADYRGSSLSPPPLTTLAHPLTHTHSTPPHATEQVVKYPPHPPFT